MSVQQLSSDGQARPFLGWCGEKGELGEGGEGVETEGECKVQEEWQQAAGTSRNRAGSRCSSNPHVFHQAQYDRKAANRGLF